MVSNICSFVSSYEAAKSVVVEAAKSVVVGKMYVKVLIQLIIETSVQFLEIEFGEMA